MIGPIPIAKIVNLALLGLFPLAWMAPLATAEFAWLLSEDITILSGIRDLYAEDQGLAIIVGLFAVVMPYVKTLTLVYAQFSESAVARVLMPVVEIMGKLSMVDVFLIALYIILYQGVGDVTVRWGLYFFTALVLLSMWCAWATRRRLYKLVATSDAEIAEADRLASLAEVKAS
ncbi:MAG: paraquat-inducible protein A [Neomegalonema sp.]|nr:paraquat-inducible protein A [Neomegalonema sp.]